MTKIDVFMYDISGIIGEWKGLPLGRDTPLYYAKIIDYVKKHIMKRIYDCYFCDEEAEFIANAEYQDGKKLKAYVCEDCMQTLVYSCRYAMR